MKLIVISPDNYYPPYLEAVSFIRNFRTRHAVVTREQPNVEKSRLNMVF
jgi:hypothetical protein